MKIENQKQHKDNQNTLVIIYGKYSIVIIYILKQFKVYQKIFQDQLPYCLIISRFASLRVSGLVLYVSEHNVNNHISTRYQYSLFISFPSFYNQFRAIPSSITCLVTTPLLNSLTYAAQPYFNDSFLLFHHQLLPPLATIVLLPANPPQICS